MRLDRWLGFGRHGEMDYMKKPPALAGNRANILFSSLGF
jgi:hypothetical protein